MKYYLAIDIGASSGRHILGSLNDGKLELEEIYRFPNSMEQINGTLCWNTKRLFTEILAGMRRCKELGKIPESVGIDTWAVDFALVDAAGALVGPTVGYRDHRTQGMDAIVAKLFPEKELYARTGIQKQSFNTIYQLMALKEQQPEILQKAEKLLMIPDYFHFLLSGVQATEYTNASTTQLVSPDTFDWDWELIDILGYPKKLFCPIVPPGTTLGTLLPEVAKQVGFTCNVTIPATHDTASAVLAVPSDGMPLYISSGTWSLMGTELLQANRGEKARCANLTNEGGYEHRFRFLKNIMGLWMIQCVRKELCPQTSFAELCSAAERESIDSIVDANDARFLAPENMYEEIRSACRESGQVTPATAAQAARVVYRSLAKAYAQTANEISALTGRSYQTLHVIGGGSSAGFLNKLTAQETGLRVTAGPGEATAAGNLLAQMIAAGEISGLAEARKISANSFELQYYGGTGL